MSETNPQPRRPEDVIAEFDRECDEARELSRRYAERVRASRANDRPVRPDKRQS